MMSGAKLTQILRDSGAGEAKLAICRDVLAADPKATGEAVLDALERAFLERRCGEGTVQKAAQILATGEYKLPERAKVVPIEDMIEAGETAPPPKAKEPPPPPPPVERAAMEVKPVKPSAPKAPAK